MEPFWFHRNGSMMAPFGYHKIEPFGGAKTPDQWALWNHHSVQYWTFTVYFLTFYGCEKSQIVAIIEPPWRAILNLWGYLLGPFGGAKTPDQWSLWNPNPRAILNLYGMYWNWCTPIYITRTGHYYSYSCFTGIFCWILYNKSTLSRLSRRLTGEFTLQLRPGWHWRGGM